MSRNSCKENGVWQNENWNKMIPRARAYFPRQFFLVLPSLPPLYSHSSLSSSSSSSLSLSPSLSMLWMRSPSRYTAHHHHRHTYFIPSAYAFNYNVSLPADYINIAPFVEVRYAYAVLCYTCCLQIIVGKYDVRWLNSLSHSHFSCIYKLYGAHSKCRIKSSDVVPTLDCCCCSGYSCHCCSLFNTQCLHYIPGYAIIYSGDRLHRTTNGLLLAVGISYQTPKQWRTLGFNLILKARNVWSLLKVNKEKCCSKGMHCIIH